MQISELHKLVDCITDLLTKADYRRIDNNIDRLIEKHQEISNDSRMGFMYAGNYYRHSKNRVLDRLPMLAFSLCDEMDRIVKDKAKVDLDKQQMGQIIGKLIAGVSTRQNLRNRLPDCIASLIPDLANLQREVSVETLISDDERLLRQYRKILPVMEVYAVGHLMY